MDMSVVPCNDLWICAETENNYNSFHSLALPFQDTLPDGRIHYRNEYDVGELVSRVGGNNKDSGITRRAGLDFDEFSMSMYTGTPSYPIFQTQRQVLFIATLSVTMVLRLASIVFWAVALSLLCFATLTNADNTGQPHDSRDRMRRRANVISKTTSLDPTSTILTV
jgi:hypothetical protein